jgi:hypothetical protein
MFSQFTEMQMSQITIHQGVQGKYYTINGKEYNYFKNSPEEVLVYRPSKLIKFDIHFPVEWALNPITTNKCNDQNFIPGPTYCMNCYFYGTYKDVFIGYCSNCTGLFEGTRGEPVRYGGLYSNISQEELQILSYMNNVSLTEIGDQEEPEYEDLEFEEEEPEVVEDTIIGKKRKREEFENDHATIDTGKVYLFR